EYISGNRVTILDEVQYGLDPGIKLKYLADRGHHLWITSSTETLLGISVLSHLVGRVSILRLYPFDQKEMALARGNTTMTDAIEKRLMDEHMQFGGLPGIIMQEKRDIKITLLRNLLETMLLKDVAGTFSISDLDSLWKLARLIALNVGSPLTKDRICSDLDLSFLTVKKYIEALTKSYLIAQVPPFYRNRNIEMKKQPRYYFLDMGLRNALINEFPATSDGRSFENYVISELIKSGFAPRYWRTKGGAEVDVVLELGREIVPIEIKTTLNRLKMERGFRSFLDKYSPDRAYMVGYHVKKEEALENGCRVKTVSMRDLLKELTVPL
ncbi:MAG: ATP-binding protein, partial [Thermoplasmata archaeon]|nr:ATP-binding protein [Thermoplasmata archaeon]